MFGLLKRIFRPNRGMVPRTRGWPRFPANAGEAYAVRQRWDRLNGRYYFAADVTLSTGETIRDVTFDSDRNVAVYVRGGDVELSPELLGASIVRCRIIATPGRDRRPRVPCPACGELLFLDTFMRSCTRHETPPDSATFTCARCSTSHEVRFEDEQISFDSIPAPDAPHLTSTLVAEIPGLGRHVEEALYKDPSR